MKTLLESVIEYERALANPAHWNPIEGAPGQRSDTRSTFYAGAASMAEQFAHGHGTLTLMIKELAILMTREVARLHERIAELESQTSYTPDSETPQS